MNNHESLIPTHPGLNEHIGRNRLVIFSGQVYELTLRVKEGLPFIPYRLVNYLLRSAMAQAQEITGVTICHFIWMSNHAHILVIANDPEMLVRFYGVIKKSLTDHMKRLLGIRLLNMWEGRKVQLIPDLETMLSRIAYFYSNPASADLADKISDYRGFSSFSAFAVSCGAFDFEHREKVDWVRPKYIRALTKRVLSDETDSAMVTEISERAYYQYDLRIEPNAWMRIFKVAPHRAIGIHQRALSLLKRRERAAREKRLRDGVKVLGDGILLQEIMSPHLPKKHERALTVICKDPVLRQYLIGLIKSTRKECYLLYHRDFKHGRAVKWPPGTFPARGPMTSLALLPTS